MNAGTMRDMVTVESQVIERDEMGGQRQIWTPYWRGKAWVRFSSGGRRVENGEVVNTMTKKVTVRHHPKFTPDMRIDICGLKYRILSMDINRRDMSVSFSVELINE